MRSISVVLVGTVFLAGLVAWGTARADPQSADARPPAGDGWRLRHVSLDERPDFVPVVRGRALIHSILYSSPGGTISMVSLLATADPRDGDATLLEINAPTTSGTGQVDLDVEVPDGLWLRGQSVVTVLYRPL
jgi:hypothetical protein